MATIWMTTRSKTTLSSRAKGTLILNLVEYPSLETATRKRVGSTSRKECGRRTLLLVRPSEGPWKNWEMFPAKAALTEEEEEGHEPEEVWEVSRPCYATLVKEEMLRWRI